MTAPAPEFSRPATLPRLGHVERFRIAADEGERAALARRFGLLAIDRFEAEVALTRLRDGARLEASIDADVVQECVVTLEPVRSRVTDEFSLLYGDVVAAEGDEAVVEALEGDSVDVGEAAAQQLSLALDPYPRASDAALDEQGAEASGADHPFAALARLKKP
jgi:uncharacterized metal-binding protein YceD (DUF177 family)